MCIKRQLCTKPTVFLFVIFGVHYRPLSEASEGYIFTLCVCPTGGGGPGPGGGGGPKVQYFRGWGAGGVPRSNIFGGGGLIEKSKFQ